MSRKKFIESEGATCKNWNWSWSFINHEAKEVLFGVSDVHEIGEEQLILSPQWEFNNLGRKSNGFGQAIEHLSFVSEMSYRLRTFRQVEIPRNEETGSVALSSFDPVLEDRLLLKKEDGWYAVLKEHPEDLTATVLPEKIFLVEGQKAIVTSVGIERNAIARRKCIEHFGLICVVCEFNFFEIYGEAGKGFIHVHHLNPIAESDGVRIVDPVNDLRPVCPNCHAIIHRGPSLRSIKEMKKLLSKSRPASMDGQ